MTRLRVIVLAVLAGFCAWDLAFSVWFGVVPVTTGLTNRLGLWAASDFIAFYAAARLAAAGDAAAAYHLPSFVAEFARVLDGQVPNIPWPYPPTVFLPLRPLSWLAPVPALWAWLAVLAVCAIAAAILMARRASAAVLVALPCVGNNLVSGQNGTITALLLAVIATAWTRSPTLAGVALGLLSYKPHLAVVPGVLALAFGCWRLLAVAAAVAAAWALLALIAFGWPIWLAFLAAASDQAVYAASGLLPFRRNISSFALLQALGAPAALALAAQFAVAGLALATVVRVWRSTADIPARTLALAAAVLLVPPYAYDYDLAVLVLPAAALLPAVLRRDADAADLALFTALATLPLLTFELAARLQIQFAPVVLVGLLVVALARSGARFNLPFGAPARS
jgi:hypothetical protein